MSNMTVFFDYFPPKNAILSNWPSMRFSPCGEFEWFGKMTLGLRKDFADLFHEYGSHR